MDDPRLALLTRRDVVALMESERIEPRRSMGQNFVVDPNTIRRIVRLSGAGPGDRVIEIGPGLGSLTLGLLEAGCDVVAVEKDHALARALLARLGDAVGERLRVIDGDALDLDWEPILDGQRRTLVANLPYNVATTIVIDLLDGVPLIDHLLVMVQREVADRMCAPPGSKVNGLPTIRIARHASARRVGLVSPDVFWPRPRVESALVEFRRHESPSLEVADESLFRELVAAGFGQRRKTLRRSLSARWPTELVDRALSASGIDPSERAERLGIEHWVALTDALSAGLCAAPTAAPTGEP